MPSRLRSRSVVLLLSAALPLLASLPACRHGSRGEGEATSVRIQWLDQAQFAGLYVADAKGYFKDQRLTVSIEPGGPDVSPVLLVASGSDDFGVSPATDVIQARSNGVPVVAIATIFQNNPVVFSPNNQRTSKLPKTLWATPGAKIRYENRILLPHHDKKRGRRHLAGQGGPHQG